MIRFLLVILFMLTGCASEQSSASLHPFEIQVDESDLPVMKQIAEYAPLNTQFNSVFTHQFDQLAVSVSNELTREKFEVTDWSSLSQKFSISTYGLPFYAGQTYQVSFSVSSTIADHVQVIFDDYSQPFYQQNFEITDQIQKVQVNYTHQGNNMDDSQMKLIFTKRSEVTSGEILLEDIRFECVSNYPYNIKVNQLGYLPESQKLAVFTYNSGDWFEVIHADTDEVVYRGQIVGRIQNPDTKEVNYTGDFSAVTAPGIYRIESQINGQSYEFEIAENLYDSLLQDTLKMITTQRCGMVLTDTIISGFEHEICHHGLARGYSSWQDVDVTGGWHDAGDYGRYTLTAVKTINDLLMSYLLYPESFSDQMGLPESNNGIADVLDEAEIGLNWLLKMQNEWGGFHTAAVTSQFAEFVLPEHDIQQMWILDDENTSTAAAAGTLALASYIFNNVDTQKAQNYLTCAIKAYDCAIDLRGQLDKKNPAEFNAGDYGNSSDTDEIYFAASMMYVLTHEEKYLNEISDYLNSSQAYFGLGYDDFSGYGTYMLMKDEQFKKTRLSSVVYNAMIDYAQNLVWDNRNDGYHLTINSYHWGANMNVANDAMMMLLIHDIEPSDDLWNCAFEQLSYLLGKNSLNFSFVSGYGTQFPKNIHHRIAQVNQSILKGALVGGPDATLVDNLPPAKQYWDDSSLYSTNEVAIYYNSPLVFVVSAFQ
ncbi:MAG: glycoside hydrolase family 9 protein [Erysipelotrichaceae bacterium]|nr:glycoside hydrolase family 9 protein [Erysipelotrichaceae bacterium]